MKTTQLILVGLGALMMFPSCNRTDFAEDAGQSGEVAFAAVNRLATRADGAIISGTVYDTDNTFRIWGWQTEAGDFSEFSADDASNFMSNLVISWNGGPQGRSSAWRNIDHYYYWPFTGALGFLAVHPSGVTPTSVGWDATNTAGAATFADYTISAGNKTTDLMLAWNVGTRRSDALPMVFRHALSQILVRVKTDADYSADLTFTLNSLRINNIDLSGDLAYANAGTFFTWTDNAAQTENWPYYSTASTVTSSVADYGAANLMIPQAANAYVDEGHPGTTISLNYTMEQTGSDPITGDVTVRAAQLWEPGKKYVYTLNFKLNEILFAPTVTDWVDVAVDTITIYE